MTPNAKEVKEVMTPNAKAIWITESLADAAKEMWGDLWGRVHSWQEKRAVLGSMSHAPGVSRVVDHLRVDPYF